jgi:hypothetical protein
MELQNRFGKKKKISLPSSLSWFWPVRPAGPSTGRPAFTPFLSAPAGPRAPLSWAGPAGRPQPQLRPRGRTRSPSLWFADSRAATGSSPTFPRRKRADAVLIPLPRARAARLCGVCTCAPPLYLSSRTPFALPFSIYTPLVPPPST